ncbi:MAG TPA: ABC transporter permease [Armatimonadota bacterium]|nr:ABC transporter permease [Armatimonadota bacterium]
MVARDLKVRYKNSVLGFFWSLINPLVQVATITIVFKYVMPIGIPNYSAYLLVAYLPWMFFQMSLLDASQSVLSHYDLLKKVYFPREVLPLSMVIANMIHFLLAIVVFFVYLLVIGAPIVSTWWLLPVLVIIEFLLVTGLAFIVSALNVFYADIKYIVSVLLNIFFYLTPIIYMSEMVYTRLQAMGYGALYTLYQLSPLNAIVMAFREALLPPYGVPPGKTMPFAFHDMPLDYRFLAIAAAVSIIVFIAGYSFFNSRKWSFAEQL